MNHNAETFAAEISNMLAATREDCTAKTISLGEYGTTYEITKPDSDKTIHLTPVEDGLIDAILYDKTGDTLAHVTLFKKALTAVPMEDLASLLAASF